MHTGSIIQPQACFDYQASQLAKAITAFKFQGSSSHRPMSPHASRVHSQKQTYEKSVLFVPVKTEELGWDEHGLYWNGTYAYPVHQIYDKEGSPIGRRRKGPQGYRFEEYYGNKKPRRPSTSSHMDDTVEEASVRLEEPAPARILGYNRASNPDRMSKSTSKSPPSATRTKPLLPPLSQSLSVALA